MGLTKKQKRQSTLTDYEQDIENNLDVNKRLSTKKKTSEIAKLKAAAKEHVRKRKKEERISIRVFTSDLKRIKEIAEEEGLPYQTLVTSILHKFSTGLLVSSKEKM